MILASDLVLRERLHSSYSSTVLRVHAQNGVVSGLEGKPERISGIEHLQSQSLPIAGYFKSVNVGAGVYDHERTTGMVKQAAQTRKEPAQRAVLIFILSF